MIIELRYSILEVIYKKLMISANNELDAEIDYYIITFCSTNQLLSMIITYRYEYELEHLKMFFS